MTLPRRRTPTTTGSNPPLAPTLLPFSVADEHRRITKELSALEIGVLYNNVGVSYDHAEVLQDVSEEKIEALLEVCPCLSSRLQAPLPVTRESGGRRHPAHSR